jgi:hypothetical protein
VPNSRAASIHARLLALAKERGEEFNLTLSRYGVERFLYRLSIHAARDRYWLKGALLFDLWFDTRHRPTRDADLLGFGPPDVEALRNEIAEICAVRSDDEMVFDPSSIRIDEIREDARYGGLRVRFTGHLGKARCHVQLDIGYGDAVVPGPEEIAYPTLLDDLPSPQLRAYPRPAVIAEKLEALVIHGMANSRMKDYYDLRALAREGAVDRTTLAQAIRATFERRGTSLPEGVPLALSEEFGADTSRHKLWQAFVTKNDLDAPSLEVVVAEVRDFLTDPLARAREG